MLLGLYWKGATRQGAVWGMLAGLGVTLYYMAINTTSLRTVVLGHGDAAQYLWWGIQPTQAAVFGVPVGVVVTCVVSYLSRRKTQQTQDLQKPQRP